MSRPTADAEMSGGAPAPLDPERPGPGIPAWPVQLADALEWGPQEVRAQELAAPATVGTAHTSLVLRSA
ncbi:hypothetical protein [Streptomyces sp. NPDC051993]|uniref:hypothetical protein n=1 Tax=Streptomyces sp. NPDC051993 TaxID=3155286 RepID=UPI003440FAA5